MIQGYGVSLYLEEHADETKMQSYLAVSYTHLDYVKYMYQNFMQMNFHIVYMRSRMNVSYKGGNCYEFHV